MHILHLLDIVLPVFIFIGIGYGLIALKLLPEQSGDALSSFVFLLPMPVLLFTAIATLDLPTVSPWPFWGAYFLSATIVFALGILITEFVFKRDARAGVIGGVSAAYANLVMVGVPVVNLALGEAGLVTIFMLIAIHLPFMMTASAILIEVAEARDRKKTEGIRLGAALLRVVKSLLRNPLVVAIFLGALFRLLQIEIGGVAETVLDRLADTAIPLALLSLGMALHKYGIHGNVRPAIVLSVVSLFVLPAIVYLTATLFGLPPLARAVLVLGAACPTGINAYLIAGRFQTGLALSANTITITTAVSLLTFTMWLALLDI